MILPRCNGRGVVVTVTTLAAAACLAVAPSSGAAPLTRLPAGRYCEGRQPTQPVTGPTKVLLVVLENESGSSVAASPDAAFMNGTVGAQCGRVPPALMHATTHGSEPNYIALVSGHDAARSASGFDAVSRFTLSDCPPDSRSTACAYGGGHLPAGTASVFSRAQSRYGAAAGWRVYADDMARPCQPYDGAPYATDALGRTYRLYVARHNPAVFYPGIACAQQDVPAGAWRAGTGAFAHDVAAGTLPAYSFFEPNEIDNGHDPVSVTAGGRTVSVAGGRSRIANTDAFLRAWLAVVAAGPDYQAGRLVVIVTFDEGAVRGPIGDGTHPDGSVGERCARQGISSAATSCHIATWIVGRYVPATAYPRYANHFTILATIQKILRLGPALGHAGDGGVGDFVGSPADSPFNLATR